MTNRTLFWPSSKWGRLFEQMWRLSEWEIITVEQSRWIISTRVIRNVLLGNIIFQYTNIPRRSFHCIICECNFDLVKSHITLRYTGFCPNIDLVYPHYLTCQNMLRSFTETGLLWRQSLILKISQVKISPHHLYNNLHKWFIRYLPERRIRMNKLWLYLIYCIYKSEYLQWRMTDSVLKWQDRIMAVNNSPIGIKGVTKCI